MQPRRWSRRPCCRLDGLHHIGSSAHPGRLRRCRSPQSPRPHRRRRHRWVLLALAHHQRRRYPRQRAPPPPRLRGLKKRVRGWRGGGPQRRREQREGRGAHRPARQRRVQPGLQSFPWRHPRRRRPCFERRREWARRAVTEAVGEAREPLPRHWLRATVAATTAIWPLPLHCLPRPLREWGRTWRPRGRRTGRYRHQLEPLPQTPRQRPHRSAVAAAPRRRRRRRKRRSYRRGGQTTRGLARWWARGRWCHQSST